VDTQTVLSPPASAADVVSGGVDPKTGMVESKFIAALRATLIDNPAGKPWPPVDLINEREKILAQMTAMVRALFMRVERRRAIPKASKKSALGIVSAMLKASKWPKNPDKTFPVPDEYSDPKFVLSFRRYEICCAMNIFYQAYHRAGGGGAASPEWPPKG
jgi:hypothetical protein